LQNGKRAVRKGLNAGKNVANALKTGKAGKYASGVVKASAGLGKAINATKKVARTNIIPKSVRAATYRALGKKNYLKFGRATRGLASKFAGPLFATM
jgi:hypothetical protein